MSRSIKKYGVIKDKGSAKSIYNKIFRRVNKQRVPLGKEPKLMREIVNDYDVCDYKFFWSEYSGYPRNTLTETRKEYNKRKRRYFGK